MNPDNALHWSQLSKMRSTPQDYIHYMTEGFGKPTPAMEFGTAVDAIVFGTTDRLAVFTGKVRNGKVWEAFKAEHAGQEIVTQATWDAAGEAAAAVLTNTEAATILDGAKCQQFLRWKQGGRDCAGTMDISGRVLAELKVTDPNPRKFYWHGMKMGWHCQLAWYYDGLIAAGHPEPESVHIIAVRPKPPHVVTVFDLDDSMLDLGRKEYHLALERLRICEDADYWPGYVEGISVWSAPDEEAA